jgi:hypothetical protein
MATVVDNLGKRALGVTKQVKETAVLRNPHSDFSESSASAEEVVRLDHNSGDM